MKRKNSWGDFYGGYGYTKLFIENHSHFDDQARCVQSNNPYSPRIKKCPSIISMYKSEVNIHTAQGIHLLSTKSKDILFNKRARLGTMSKHSLVSRVSSTSSQVFESENVLPHSSSRLRRQRRLPLTGSLLFPRRSLRLVLLLQHNCKHTQ